MDINATILGQAITFAILIWFTMKFVWPPLNNMMEQRAKRIADGLAAAEKGKQQLQDAEASVALELKKVQAQAGIIIANAEKRSIQIVDEAKERALQESEKIIIAAKAQMEQDLMRMKEDLRSQVSHLIIRGVEQILRVECDQSQHKKILAQLTAEL